MAKAGNSNPGGSTTGDAAQAAPPKVVGEVPEASGAKEGEVAPLREEMERKLERAGTKKKSSAGENA